MGVGDECIVSKERSYSETYKNKWHLLKNDNIILLPLEWLQNGSLTQSEWTTQGYFGPWPRSACMIM